MAYKQEYLDDLNEIISLIKDNKISGENEALQKFDAYIDTISDIGPFSIEEWKEEWREKVYDLGELFATINPQNFLQALEKKSLLNSESVEAIDFIGVEIRSNFLKEVEYKKNLEYLKEKYFLNPEFRHTLGHYYKDENKYPEAIIEYKLALKIDPNNESFLESRFRGESEYLNDLIINGDYELANTYLEKIFDENIYLKKNTLGHNSMVNMNSRIQDHLIFQNKIKQTEVDIKEKLNIELNTERKRTIEIIGFFSAIIAFILTTISIATKYPFNEAIKFIIALGLILILFAVALSTLFVSAKTKLIKDVKFWVMVAGLLSLLAFIIFKI